MRVFLTFGDGDPGLQAALRRITREATRVNIFDDVIAYDFAKLRKDHPDFWSKHSDFIAANKRGAGYWLWKSFIIKATLEKMAEGDVLFYSDAGCDINTRLRGHIADLEPGEFDITLFELRNHTNQSWTNSLTLKTLGASDQICALKQLIATVILIKKTKAAQSLVEDWYRFCCLNDHQLLVDRDDAEPTGFQEHRHDQSILSILARQRIVDGQAEIKILPESVIKSPSIGITVSRNRSGYPAAVLRLAPIPFARRCFRAARRVLKRG